MQLFYNTSIVFATSLDFLPFLTQMVYEYAKHLIEVLTPPTEVPEMVMQTGQYKDLRPPVMKVLQMPKNILKRSSKDLTVLCAHT